MVRLAVNELTTYRWTLEEDLKHYAALGIEGIGVWRHKLSDCGEEAGIDLISASGLHVSSLLWAGGFTGSDGRPHRDSIDDGIEALQVAASLRAGCLVVYTGSRGGHTRAHARRMSFAALQELSGVALDLEVTLAIEPMHPGCGIDWTFLHGAKDAVRLIEEVGSPALQLVFDTYHLGQSPEILAQLPDIAPHVALVHLGDAHRPPAGEQDRCLLGAGQVPLSEIIIGLQQLGYDGYYELELLGQEVEGLDYCEMLRLSRQTVDEIVRVANRA